MREPSPPSLLAPFLAALLAAACDPPSGSQDPADAATQPPDAGSAAPLTVTVLVRPGDDATVIEVRVRERDRPCDCTALQWAAIGTCETWSDAVSCDCQPPPGSCLGQIRAERGGTVLDTWDDGSEMNWVGHFWLRVPGPWAATDLVLEGCGGEARIALAADGPVPAFVSELTREEGSLTVHWISAQLLDGALVQTGWTLMAALCHEPPDGATSVTTWQVYYMGGVLALTFDVVRRSTVETALGTAEIYLAGSRSFPTVYYPALAGTSLLPTGDWNGAHAEAWLTVNGQRSQVTLSTATIDVATGALDVTGEGFEYQATATTDTLAVGVESASFPHVAPVDPLELGSPGPETFAIAVGPVTLPSGKLAALELTWELGATARPVP